MYAQTTLKSKAIRPAGDCKARTTMFDYYGLSQRVAAERLSPWEYVGGGGFGYENEGDKFHESYTYGPVGVTTRTVETEDADPGDNFDHWVLPDVFGGTTGLLLYDAQPGQRAAVFEHFDAFGVRAGTTNWGPDEDASRYRWRSQEGSETDDLAISTTEEVELAPPTLVYMQTRHYDPSLGRFIMADSIPMGAFSPQGLNRYAYCTNDPVNCSDRSGRLTFLGWLIVILLLEIAIGLGLQMWIWSLEYGLKAQAPRRRILDKNDEPINDPCTVLQDMGPLFRAPGTSMTGYPSPALSPEEAAAQMMQEALNKLNDEEDEP